MNVDVTLPRGVTAVGHGHISDAKVIEHAQITQTAVDGMASFQAHQTGEFVFFKSVQYPLKSEHYFLNKCFIMA